MTGRIERWALVWTVALAAVSLAPTARGQDRCFAPVGGGGGAADPVVSLTDRVRVSGDCRYALAPEGPWLPLEGGARPFVALHAALARRTAGRDAARPRFLYGRPAEARGRGGVVQEPERLTLRLCSHYLLDGGSAFEIDAGERLVVSRVAAPPSGGCSGRGLELRAFDLSEGAAAPPVRRGQGARTLTTSEGSLPLAHGRWAFYAAPAGADWGLRVGVVDSTAPTTPLRAWVTEAGSPAGAGGGTAVPPLAAARWDGQGGALVFRPALDAGAGAAVWAELRSAVAAGLAWIGRDEAGEVHRVDGAVRFVPGGAGFQLSDALVDGYMADRYGEAGKGLAPTLDDWKGLVDGLAVCTAGSYREALAPDDAGSRWSVRGGAVDWRCAKLAALVELERAAKAQVADAGGAEDAGGPTVCIERGTVRLGAEDATRRPPGDDAEPVCVAVDGDAPARVPLAVVGDRVTARGLGDRRLCISLDDAPLEVNGDDPVPLDRPGLVEVRLGAGGADGCRSRQGLSLVRIGVLDPDREWHPVGLYTGGEPRDGSTWRTLDHDEPGTFAFRPSRQTLDTRLSSSALVAAAVDAAPGRRAHLPQHVPLLGGVEGTFGGTTPPRVQAWVSREDQCPAAPAGELAREAPLDPDRLPPDATFHVFLVEVDGPGAPPHCLAKASFRVRPARAFVTAAPSEYLRFELGVVGDPRAVVFLTDPQAAGLYLPLLWLRLGFLPWLGLQVDASGVLAGAFDVPALSRTGLGFSAAVDFGVPEILPRLVSVGAMVHLAGNWHPTNDPVASLFVSVNLAPLVHLVGGL